MSTPRRAAPGQRMRGFVDHSGLLVVGAALALVWANARPHSYGRVAHALQFPVNDIGMAFFFALAAKEVVEATAPGGPLHSPRRSAMPVLAAVGGMVGPALIYLVLVAAFDRPELRHGWAIPCATDIAFSAVTARLVLGRRHPGIPFLLLLAIVDDALGLVILGAVYPAGTFRPADFLAILAVALALAWIFRRSGIRSWWPYILGAGTLSWIAFYRGGIHPALALVPVIPFLPHAKPSSAAVVASAHRDTLSAFERQWKTPVQLMLFFFGLVNAGVAFGSVGAGTWIVLAAILLGKPLGIVSATAAGVAAGLHRPNGVTWRDLTVLAVIAGIGFTVALFFATAAFPEGLLRDQAKMGALLSLSAAILAAAAARLSRPQHRRQTLVPDSRL